MFISELTNIELIFQNRRMRSKQNEHKENVRYLRKPVTGVFVAIIIDFYKRLLSIYT